MRRPVGFRLTMGLLAWLAMSMDTADKVLHGVVHERESVAPHEHAEAHHHMAPADASDANHPSMPGLDETDVDHEVLHHPAAASILATTVLAVAAVVEIPVPVVSAASAPLPRGFRVYTPPPFFDTGPDQPRAPPVG